jgi:GTP-binding protein LepA
LEIVQERLEREYDLSIILSVPSVRYRFTLTDGTVLFVDNPAHYPTPCPSPGAKSRIYARR